MSADTPLIITPVPDAAAALVVYDVNEAALAQMREVCAAMSADTPDGYEEIRVAIGKLRSTRTAIEKRRTLLKADALRFGRLVDSEAQRLTALVAGIEDPLRVKKQAVDDEAARQKAAEEAARVKALEEEIAARRAAQEAEARAQREAEEKRLAEERAKLAEERKALEAAQEKARQEEAERQRVWEAERVAAEKARQQFEAEQQRAKEAELAKIAAEQRAEAARLEAERKALEEQRRLNEAVERERQERLRREEAAQQAKLAAERREKARQEVLPDLDKVVAFRLRILSCLCEAPGVKAEELREVLVEAVADVTEAVDRMKHAAEALAGRA
jgi:DNA repair exonuclease SbcCD ATPase subunit